MYHPTDNHAVIEFLDIEAESTSSPPRFRSSRVTHCAKRQFLCCSVVDK